MFKTRQRKIAEDVLSRKGRTALVSLSIFIVFWVLSHCFRWATSW
jgi:hypothetical protein